VGAWKRESNSTLAKVGGKTVLNDTYAHPADVPHLMQEWIREFQLRRSSPECPALESFICSSSTSAVCTTRSLGVVIPCVARQLPQRTSELRS
jgi:hypothetical protein